MIAIKAYCKKPIQIKAAQWDGSLQSAQEIQNWVCDNKASMSYFGGILTIMTLEGAMKVSPGDYVIQGVKGEFYPCKPDVFRETYEEVGI